MPPTSRVTAASSVTPTAATEAGETSTMMLRAAPAAASRIPAIHISFDISHPLGHAAVVHGP